MPVIDFQSPVQFPPSRLFVDVANEISAALQLPEDRVWLLWHQIPQGSFFRSNWEDAMSGSGPIIRVRCKNTYSQDQKTQIIEILVRQTSVHCGVEVGHIYVVIDPVLSGSLFVRGEIWS